MGTHERRSGYTTKSCLPHRGPRSGESTTSYPRHHHWIHSRLPDHCSLYFLTRSACGFFLSIRQIGGKAQVLGYVLTGCRPRLSSAYYCGCLQGTTDFLGYVRVLPPAPWQGGEGRMPGARSFQMFIQGIPWATFFFFFFFFRGKIVFKALGQLFLGMDGWGGRPARI